MNAAEFVIIALKVRYKVKGQALDILFGPLNDHIYKVIHFQNPRGALMI